VKTLETIATRVMFAGFVYGVGVTVWCYAEAFMHSNAGFTRGEMYAYLAHTHLPLYYASAVVAGFVGVFITSAFIAGVVKWGKS
jgi:hypothetical protein